MFVGLRWFRPILTTGASSPAAANPATSPSGVAPPKGPDGYSPGGSPAARTFNQAPPTVSPPSDLSEDLNAERLRASIGQGAGDAGGPSLVARRSAAVYDRNGNTPYNLDDPAQRQALIRNSPQIDNNPNIPNDRTRCGGAAVTNALIYDGSHAKNAEAIRRTASDVGVTMTANQRAAVDALGRGSLTPTQSAEIQNLMTLMGTKQPPGANKAPRGDSEGMSAAGMADLTSRLRSHGGFEGTQSVHFRMAYNNGEAHWSTVHTNKQGQTSYADSWPDRTGHARAGQGYNLHGSFTVKGSPNPAWIGDVTMVNQGPNVYMQTRVADSEHADRYVEMRATVPSGAYVAPEDYQRTLQRDRFTNATIAEMAGTPWHRR